MDKILSALVGKTMWACRRAADMAMFQFGQRRHVRDYYGRSSEVGEFALHVQCPWRVVQQDTVLVGSGDLNYPAEYADGEPIPEDFDWDRDPNRRDTLINRLFGNGAREFVVRDVDVRIGGMCRLDFADGMHLELFPDDSLGHEHWRLFATEDGGAQFIMTGAGGQGR